MNKNDIRVMKEDDESSENNKRAMEEDNFSAQSQKNHVSFHSCISVQCIEIISKLTNSAN